MGCKRKERRSEEILPPLMEVSGASRFYQSHNEENWFKQDQVRAVDDVSFTLYQGETLGLVGESGCGKSTLGKMLIGLEKPSEGRILYRNRDLLSLRGEEERKARTDLQMIFQDPYSSLNPRKRIYDILSAPLRYHKIVPEEKIDQEVKRLIELVGLPQNSSRRYPHEFSGGQLQRLGIAAALSLRPKLIVCDEPVSALDVSIQAQILNLLCSLQQEMGFSYLFIAHGLAVVKYISDRIAVMYLGRIVEIAPAEELFRNPIHPYTQALISASPIPHPNLPSDPDSLLEGEVPSNINPPSGCPFHPRCPLAEESCRKERPELAPDESSKPEESCRAYRKAHCVACPVMLKEREKAKAEGREPRLAFAGARRTADFKKEEPHAQ